MMMMMMIATEFAQRNILDDSSINDGSADTVTTSAGAASTDASADFVDVISRRADLTTTFFFDR